MHNCEMEYKKVNTLEYYKCKICGKYIDAGVASKSPPRDSSLKVSAPASFLKDST